jgi:O-antigen ligase
MIIIMTVSIGSLVVFREDVYMLRYVVDARFSDTFEEASEEGKATSGIDARMEMNKGALQAFMRSPLIGVGYKNSRWIWPTVDAHVPDNWVYQPHNVYMVMLVEGGILLFIIYVVFTFYPFFKLWRCRKSNEPLMIAYFLSLTVGIGIQMIYITFTSPGFAAVYTMILGCAMGYFDQELIKLKGKS